MRTRASTIFMGAIAFACVVSTGAAAVESHTNRPLVAVWRDSDGMPKPGTRAAGPYLRVAIWEDGRVLYSADGTNHWGHNLRAGQISSNRVAALKQSLTQTGVFGLEGTTYLVPDAARSCVLVAFDGQQQILYWDEVEKPGYGININPQPRHREFIRAWKQVNALALAAAPAESQPWTNRFERPPVSWYVKRAIQSR